MHPIIFVALLTLGGAEPGPVTIELLSIESETLAKTPQSEVKVESGGRSVTYAGVPLNAILGGRANFITGMPGLRDLSDAVLLVRGADGYQAAVSAASVAMDLNGERYLLAKSRDGQSMSPQLIIPADPKHARWVRDVVAIRLVRLNALVRAAP